MIDPDDADESEAEYLDDPVLCVHCTKTIPWDANLCVHCKAPQNFIACADPYQRIHAEGFILRTAAEKPRSWLTLIGIWVIHLPPAVVLLSLAGSAMTPVGWLGMQNTLGSVMVAAWGLPSTLLIARTTWNFVRLRREDKGR